MKCFVNGLEIQVCEKVLVELKKYFSICDGYETGGILLGKFSRKRNLIEIDEIYELRAKSISQVIYKRNVAIAQEIIDRRWSETDGLVNYVGEWHTHPKMTAIPSQTDICSLREIIYKTNLVIPGLIMLIAGRNNELSLTAGNIESMQSHLFMNW